MKVKSNNVGEVVKPIDARVKERVIGKGQGPVLHSFLLKEKQATLHLVCRNSVLQ